ncbi:radical SAM protein, partial [Candidatus Latescibacterota bacterium]
MKTYNKFFGFKSIFYFCSLPLRLDSYKGCTFGCLYCFSQSLNNRKEGFHKEVIPANYKKFSKFMESALLQESGNGLLKSCVRKKIPIHFGCVSDPLQPYESKKKTTLHLLNILNDFKYPFIFCTKSDLIKKKEYLDIIKKSDVSVQISFSTLDDRLGKLLEPNAPSPTERLNILKILAENNIRTVARIQPFIYPKENIKYSTFKKFSEAGVKHIVLEHLRIPTNSRIKTRKKLWSALEMDILDEYKKLGVKFSRV